MYYLMRAQMQQLPPPPAALEASAVFPLLRPSFIFNCIFSNHADAQRAFTEHKVEPLS